MSEEITAEVVEPRNLPAFRPSRFPAAYSAETVRGMSEHITSIMRAVMQKGLHYGTIPGSDKPFLHKPGAEILARTFDLRIIAEPGRDVVVSDLGNGHREYIVYTRILNGAGDELATGLGSCSTMESKYRWRNGTLPCPECGFELRKSKREPEWYCWKTKGGCGATFPLDEFTAPDRVENPDIADVYNTVLKIGKKRSMIDGVLTACGASDLFSQDLDEIQEVDDPQEGEKGDVENRTARRNGRASGTSTRPAPRSRERQARQNEPARQKGQGKPAHTEEVQDAITDVPPTAAPKPAEAKAAEDPGPMQRLISTISSFPASVETVASLAAVKFRRKVDFLNELSHEDMDRLGKTLVVIRETLRNGEHLRPLTEYLSGGTYVLDSPSAITAAIEDWRAWKNGTRAAAAASPVAEPA